MFKFVTLSFLILSFYVVSFGQQFSDTLWSDSYGGSLSESAGFGNANFGSPSVSAANNEGYLYLLSYSSSDDLYVPDNNGEEDVFLLKIEEESGDTIWTRNYGGSATERAYDLLVHSDDYIYLAGRTSSDDGDFEDNNGNSDAFLIKIDLDGDLIWTRNYGGNQAESFYGIVEAPNGNIVAVGEAGSSDGDLSTINVGTGFAWIIELDKENGNIEWQDVTAGIQEPTNPDHIENFWDVILLEDQSGYITVGSDGDFNDFTTDDVMVMRYDLNGNKVWEKGYGGNQRDWAAGLIEYDEKLYIAGNAGGTGDDISNFYGVTDVWLLQLDLDGNLIEEKVFGGSDLDYPYGIEFDAENNQLLISGITRSDDLDLEEIEEFGGIDAWAFYVDPENINLTEQYRWGGTADDFAHQAVFKNENGSPIIVGRTNSSDEYFYKDFNSTALFVTSFANESLNIENQIIQNESLTIYPNPTSKFINLDISENTTIDQLQIIDLQGRVVVNATDIENNNFSIDVQELEMGTYNLVLQSSSSILTKKFIKKDF